MPPPASNEGVPRWVLLFGLVTIALCFGVAYHWGSLGEDEASLENIKIMEHRVDLVLSEAKKCVKDRTSIFAAAAKRNKNANDTRYASLKAKQLAYEALLQEEAAIHANASICLDAVRHLNVKLEQDEETAPERMRQLNRLNAQTRDVTDQIAALKKGDKGMRRNLLLESLRQAREKHLHLAEALGEQVNMDDDYDNEILQQYKPKQRNITASDIVRLTSNSTAAMSIQKFIDRWSNFTFNASVHTKVFIPANNGPDTNETIERPKWFDREGAAPEVLGTVIGNLSAPITTTAFAIKSLTTVALCAFRNNNSNLTFPNRFRRVDRLHQVELLNNTVESPLVTFCRQCVSTVSQPVFRLACGRDKPNRLYGTYDFWAARSMIRPTPAVVDAARVKFNQLGLSGRNVLGVAYKKSPQLALKCQHQRKPQRHYMWARALANRSNDTLFEAVPGMNQTEQCQPTIATLFTAVDALRQKFKFDAVLISVQTAEEEKIVMNTEFGGAMQVVAIRPSTGFEDMAELLITSWANHILVNRYSDHSQVLTEMFALRNGIRANRIHFF